MSSARVTVEVKDSEGRVLMAVFEGRTVLPLANIVPMDALAQVDQGSLTLKTHRLWERDPR